MFSKEELWNHIQEFASKRGIPLSWEETTFALSKINAIFNSILSQTCVTCNTKFKEHPIRLNFINAKPKTVNQCLKIKIDHLHNGELCVDMSKFCNYCVLKKTLSKEYINASVLLHIQSDYDLYNTFIIKKPLKKECRCYYDFDNGDIDQSDYDDCDTCKKYEIEYNNAIEKRKLLLKQYTLDNYIEYTNKKNVNTIRKLCDKFIEKDIINREILKIALKYNKTLNILNTELN
jgi:hypothetical protein